MEFFHYLADQIKHFYLVATVISLVGYAAKTVYEIMKDAKKREADPQYYPNIRYGDIAQRIIGSIIPVFNLWMIVYLLVPNLWNLVEHFFEFMDKPIVPKKPKEETK